MAKNARYEVELDIISVEERAERQFNSRIKSILETYGPDNVTIISSGIYFQGAAKSYWAILAVGSTPVKKIVT